MKIEEYIEQLFAKYHNSAAMEDFKEELCVNLRERIAYLESKGLSAEEAFEKTVKELGDVSEVADQICNEKRKDVIASAYLNKNYLTRRHIIGYLLSGGLLAFGIITAILSFFYTSAPNSALGVLIPFGTLPVACIVFLALTQETASSFPMNWKRALLYSVAVGVILFGLLVFGITATDVGVVEAVATLIPFVLPGSVFLAALILTQKRRSKPWVLAQEAEWAEMYSSPAAMSFGMYSGALWVFAFGLFIVLGLLIGFKYSWLVFVFAVAAQVFIQGWLYRKR